MQVRRLREPHVPKAYDWLRIVVIAVGIFTLFGGMVAALIAFQRDMLVGLMVSFAAVLAVFFVLAMAGIIFAILSIEENLRKANTMAPYTMQSTTNLTAIHDVMEEVTVHMHSVARRMNTLDRTMQDLTEKLDSVALYSRTTAVLIHRQQNGSTYPHHNGAYAPQNHQGAASGHERLHQIDVGQEHASRPYPDNDRTESDTGAFRWMRGGKLVRLNNDMAHEATTIEHAAPVAAAADEEHDQAARQAEDLHYREVGDMPPEEAAPPEPPRDET
jgi:hypothetical protein